MVAAAQTRTEEDGGHQQQFTNFMVPPWRTAASRQAGDDGIASAVHILVVFKGQLLRVREIGARQCTLYVQENIVDFYSGPCANFVSVIIHDSAGNAVKYLRTLEGSDVQLGHHSVFPNHQCLVQNFNSKLSHMYCVKVVVGHIQHISHVEGDAESSIVKGDGGSIESRRKHGDGAREEKVHHETCHQETDGHGEKDVQLRSPGLQPLVSIRNKGHQLLFLFPWDPSSALASRAGDVIPAA